MEMRCGTERRQVRWSHMHMWWIKIRRATSGMKDPSPRPDHTAQGSSTRKIKPHNLWLKKPVGVGWQKELLDFQGTQLKGPAWS